MKHRIFLLLAFIFCLASIENAMAQDSTSLPSLKAGLSRLGGDFIIDGEIHELHFIKGGESHDVGAGPGLEIRVHPFFVGAIVGLSGNLGMPYYPNSSFSFSTLYVGAIIHDYRFEIGQTYGSFYTWATHSYPEPWGSNGAAAGLGDYTFDYLGISKRWSNVLFVEPEIKMVFPLVAHYDYYPDGYDPFVGVNKWFPVTQRYHLKDLYFTFTLKLGIGYN